MENPGRIQMKTIFNLSKQGSLMLFLIFALTGCGDRPIIIPSGFGTPTPTSTSSITPLAETPTLEETATLEITPNPPEPTTSLIDCGNPYWPVSAGAEWDFRAIDEFAYAEITWTISPGQFVNEADEKLQTFTISFSSTNYISPSINFECNQTGIYQVLDDGSRIIMVPTESELIPGGKWSYPSIGMGAWVKVHSFTNVETPAGNYEAVVIFVYDGNTSGSTYTYYFVRGIGPVMYDWSAPGAGGSPVFALYRYDIPDESISTFENEDQVRYILADAQLMGGIEYYRQFTDQPVIVEALRRWDSSVRVTNISEFDRIQLSDQGWKVVYKNTLTMINGMDVILTTDAADGDTNNNPTTSHYTIQAGDNLISIAARFSISLEALLAANPDVNQGNNYAINVGQVLTIPAPTPTP